MKDAYSHEQNVFYFTYVVHILWGSVKMSDVIITWWRHYHKIHRKRQVHKKYKMKHEGWNIQEQMIPWLDASIATKHHNNNNNNNQYMHVYMYLPLLSCTMRFWTFKKNRSQKLSMLERNKYSFGICIKFHTKYKEIFSIFVLYFWWGKKDRKNRKTEKVKRGKRYAWYA